MTASPAVHRNTEGPPAWILRDWLRVAASSGVHIAPKTVQSSTRG